MTQVLRIAALISVAMAVGGMTRYYLGRPRMPWAAYVGFLCYSIAVAGGLILNLSRGGTFRWWLSPFALVGSVAILVGLWPRLSWRHK